MTRWLCGTVFVAQHYDIAQWAYDAFPGVFVVFLPRLCSVVPHRFLVLPGHEHCQHLRRLHLPTPMHRGVHDSHLSDRGRLRGHLHQPALHVQVGHPVLVWMVYLYCKCKALFYSQP